ADRDRRFLVGAGLLALAHRLFDGRCRGNGDAPVIIDDLSVDVLARTEHRQPLALAGSAPERAAHAPGAPQDPVLELGHAPLRYFFLPSLRKMYSPAYLMPLPL